MSETPWMDWFEKRKGWKESNPAQNSALAKGWKWVKQKFKDITGRAHAWCAMSLATALAESGYSIEHANAAAISYVNVGVRCSLGRGAIIVIKHFKGGYHVTCVEHVIHNEPGNIIIDCLGGNQHDSICTARYNLSGHEYGQDEIVAIRWPIKVASAKAA